ncbi:MAG: CDP-alcohol phosphatidyltransferase family protein [Bacteroidales bacterium]|nr:CDP-alcohol phosphatidyltransferase family protein [Bacteroidales bacterium]
MPHTSSPKITLESSLKAIEIENFLDRYFYRPVAFRIALILRHTFVTPNMITILSIFFGVFAGYHFYSTEITVNAFGVLLLIIANILDCVDGQLARLTGIKSKIGRILDGFAGDLWFLSVYFFISLRLMNEGWPIYIFIVAILSAFSHSRQAAIADYFKNLHLYFVKGAAGSEFDEYEAIQKKFEQLTWKNDFWEKFFLHFYRFYTRKQERMLPEILKLRHVMAIEFPDTLPKEITDDFKKMTKNAIRWMHLFAFNGRTPVLFLSVLLGIPWVYFLFEIIVLNISLLLSVKHYRQISNTLIHSIAEGKYAKG